MTAPDDRASSPSATEEGRRSRNGSPVRLIVLLAILAVAAAAAGWDWFVARPGHERAVKAAERFLPTPAEGEEDAPPPPAGPATQDEVHAAIEAEPVTVDTAGPYLIERYAWRRGIPWAEYELWLVYDGEDPSHPLLNATTKRQEVDLYYATAQHAAPAGDAPPPTPADNEVPSGSDAPSDAAASPEAEESDEAETPTDS